MIVGFFGKYGEQEFYVEGLNVTKKLPFGGDCAGRIGQSPWGGKCNTMGKGRTLFTQTNVGG